MKIYLVGGAVRDELLGLKPNDLDWVVVGATEQQMLDLGYSKVGADFPVFLNPDTGEEYALARRERSTGPGYNDFEVEFSPDVTIEEDLRRRDFTINAIAKDMETGELIDPFSGVEDLRKRVLRMVDVSSFAEDPVRVLRLARFAAKFPAFKIDAYTLMETLEVELKYVTAERVGLELSKALMCAKPSRFFDVLFGDIGFIADDWFLEIRQLIGVPQPIKWHAEGDAYIHTMMVLDSAAKHNEPLEVRLGCLLHDVGKFITKGPSHPAHEILGVPLAIDFCNRLKLSADLRKFAMMATKYHMHVHKAYELRGKTYIKVYEDIKNKPLEIASIIARVAFHDNEGRLPYEGYGNRAEEFFDNIEKLICVKLSNKYSPEEIEAMSIDNRKNKLHNLRLEALK